MRGPVCITCGDIAILMRVLRIGADGIADCVTGEGDAEDVDVTLLDEVVPGDEVLVHAKVALQRVVAS